MKDRSSSRKVHTIRFIIIQNNVNSRKETAVLAKLEICTDKIITLYHLILFAGHQGVIRHI